MTGRTIVITGASDGIGAAAARALAAEGERIVVVGRSRQKTEAVARDIGADHFVADFADLQQVRGLAAALREQYPRIDVLANNAGGIMGPRELTEDGHERTFQVNHLAPFLLTTELLDVLAASKASVINTSSMANRYGRIDLNDLENARRYTANRAYGASKLANILFTRELHRRYAAQGITTAAFHPGGVASNFAADSTPLIRFAYNPLFRRFMITPEQGADTLVWLATSAPGPDWVSGGYYWRRRIAKANPQADDDALAREFWERSAELVKG